MWGTNKTNFHLSKRNTYSALWRSPVRSWEMWDALHNSKTHENWGKECVHEHIRGWLIHMISFLTLLHWVRHYWDGSPTIVHLSSFGSKAPHSRLWRTHQDSLVVRTLPSPKKPHLEAPRYRWVVLPSHPAERNCGNHQQANPASTHLCYLCSAHTNSLIWFSYQTKIQ